MNQKGGILIGLILVSLLIIPLLVIFNFGYLDSLTNSFSTGNSGEDSVSDSTNPIGFAQQTKIQADLRVIMTSLEAYYAENGAYPASLAEASDYFSGTDTTNIVYTACSSSSVILYHNSESYPGYILGEASPQPTSGSIPSC